MSVSSLSIQNEVANQQINGLKQAENNNIDVVVHDKQTSSLNTESKLEEKKVNEREVLKESHNSEETTKASSAVSDNVSSSFETIEGNQENTVPGDAENSEKIKNEVTNTAPDNSEETRNSKVKSLLIKFINFLKQNKKSIIIGGTLLGLGALSITGLILAVKHQRVHQMVSQESSSDLISNLLQRMIKKEEPSLEEISNVQVKIPNVQVKIGNRTKFDSKRIWH